MTANTSANAAKFAIDKNLLERIEAIMPSYHHKRTFINMLIESGLEARERAQQEFEYWQKNKPSAPSQNG